MTTAAKTVSEQCRCPYPEHSTLCPNKATHRVGDVQVCEPCATGHKGAKNPTPIRG